MKFSINTQKTGYLQYNMLRYLDLKMTIFGDYQMGHTRRVI